MVHVPKLIFFLAESWIMFIVPTSYIYIYLLTIFDLLAPVENHVNGDNNFSFLPIELVDQNSQNMQGKYYVYIMKLLFFNLMWTRPILCSLFLLMKKILWESYFFYFFSYEVITGTMNSEAHRIQDEREEMLLSLSITGIMLNNLFIY